LVLGKWRRLRTPPASRGRSHKLGSASSSPTLGVGTKAAVSSVAAVATGGLSLLGQGLLDRVRGSKDLCEEMLTEAAGKAK